MKHCIFLVTVLWSLASLGKAEPPSVSPFPKHPPVDLKTLAPNVRESIAKVKVGRTRKDAAYDLQPKGGTMLSSVETYYFGPDLSPGDPDTLFFDIVFRPATMSEAAFARSRANEDQLRRAGSWPVADPRDVIQAVSKPYRGPRPHQESGNEFVLEVSTLSAAARQCLQSLKVGMTRREVQRTLDPARGLVRPPTEPYSMRNAHQGNGPMPIVVEIAFKPAAMDQSTYDDPSLRAAWFREHTWLPGDNLDDTVMDFQTPRGGEFTPDEPVIDVHKLVEKDRERLAMLKVGMTRKQLHAAFDGGYSPIPLRGLYFISDAQTPHILKDPGHAYLSIEVSFRPAGTNLPGSPFGKYLDHFPPFAEESGDDVVTGFTRPFESSQGLNWD